MKWSATGSQVLKVVYKQTQSNTRSFSHNAYLDLGLASWFVAHLWSLCVHVNISLVFHLASKHLGPGLKASLQTHSQDAFNLRKKSKNRCE